MSVKEIDNANTTRANTIRGNVYTIYTNKYIEQLPNKLTITSISVHSHSTYTSGSYRALEKVKTRIFYIEKVLQNEGVRM